MPASVLPHVDFGPFMVDEGVLVGEGPTEAQRHVAQQIDRACRDHGFLYLTNFGLTQAQHDAAFAASKGLFSLPEAAKLEGLSRLKPSTNMGYSPVSSEHLNRGRGADLKEAFNVRCRRAHTNNYGGCPDPFVASAEALWDTVEEAARRYSAACAVGLGLEPAYFQRSMERYDLCTLRFLHYPPCDPPADPLQGSIRVGEHTDFGAFTFLLLGEGPKGLQIMPVEGGEVGGAAGGEDSSQWSDAVVPDLSSQVAPDGSTPCGAVVNTGALFARWTNDTWRATAHRVVVADAEVAGTDRYSIACFFDPDADARVEVDPRFVPEGERPRYGPTTGAQYLQMKIDEALGNTP